MFDYQPHLQGPRLELRPTRPDDWAQLYALGGDPEVWAVHPARDRWMEDRFRAYFDDGLASGGALTAVDRDSGSVAGWSRFSSQFALPGEIEIGWTFLGRPYWGGAWNGEMKRLMLTHAFAFVDRVIFRIGEHNGRSRRAVEKLGARLTDRTQGDDAPGGAGVTVFYALERGDFAG